MSLKASHAGSKTGGGQGTSGCPDYWEIEKGPPWPALLQSKEHRPGRMDFLYLKSRADLTKFLGECGKMLNSYSSGNTQVEQEVTEIMTLMTPTPRPPMLPSHPQSHPSFTDENQKKGAKTSICSADEMLP